MGKNSRVSLLAKALPVALMMTGTASQALSFEFSAARTIGGIGEAIDQGWLHDAQDTLNQLRLCGVRAFQIGNDTLRLAVLDQAITELAVGDTTTWSLIQAAVQSTKTGTKALFITDGGLVANCTVPDNPTDNSSTFPAGSVA